jgi:outer membrane protein TolC
MRDYNNGLVTNLEVLSASQAHLDARQQRDLAVATLCNDWVQLRVSAGENPVGNRAAGTGS